MDDKHGIPPAAVRRKVENCVAAYVGVHAREFAQFKIEQQMRRAELGDEKYGTAEGDHVIERVLLDVPETLYDAIVDALDAKNDVEMALLMSTKGYARWFAKRFPDFARPSQI